MKTFIIDCKGHKETEYGLFYEIFYKLFDPGIDDDIDVVNFTCGKYINRKHDGVSPISIDETIDILNTIKGRGCTHVEIDYHSDHDSYIFNGVEIREATKDDLAIINKNTKSEKQLKLEKLEKERKKIEYEINLLKDE